MKVLDLVYSQKLHHIVEQEPVVKYITLALADLGGMPGARPLRNPILLFLHTFLPKSAHVGGPPPNGSTPSRAREAKEAIHIRKLDPELNRNLGKMAIPHVFDSLLGIKPKNSRIALLLSQEVGSQDIGINLTQFHSCVDKRVNHCSNRAQTARNFISN